MVTLNNLQEITPSNQESQELEPEELIYHMKIKYFNIKVAAAGLFSILLLFSINFREMISCI
jgi:hypothetical protein